MGCGLVQRLDRPVRPDADEPLCFSRAACGVRRREDPGECWTRGAVDECLGEYPYVCANGVDAMLLGLCQAASVAGAAFEVPSCDGHRGRVVDRVLVRFRWKQGFSDGAAPSSENPFR